MSDLRNAVMRSVGSGGGSAPAPAARPASPVARPTAPAPQAAPEEEYVSIFDRWWTDDFAAIPVVGSAASVVGGAVGATVARVGEGYDKWNQALSWGIAKAPGGMDQMSWESAGDVSPMQAGVTNALTANREGGVSGFFAGGGIIGEGVKRAFTAEDGNNPALREGFDVTKQGQRDEAFAQGGAAQAVTGLGDTVAAFFLDPLVVVGKGIKIARVGSDMLGYAGLTNRSIASGKSVQKVGDEADTAMSLINDSSDNMLGTMADEVVKGDFVALREMPQFDGAHRDLLASIGAGITDKADAITFIAAAAGNQKYIQKLRTDHHSAFDALSRAKGESLYERSTFDAVSGVWSPPVLDKALEASVDARLLIDDLTKRNTALGKAVGNLGEGQQLITRMGMVDTAVSVRGARIAQAYRAGRTGGTAPAGFETVFRVSGAMRPVRVWEWLGGEHASGYIAVRGPDIGKSSDEMQAALTDSKTIAGDKAFQREMMNLWGDAAFAKDRTAAAMQIETKVINHLADKYGVTNKALVKDMYKRLDERRWSTVKQFKDRTYGIDPEDGSVITIGPLMMSQLETKMPMLDFRVLEESVKIAGRGEYNWALRDKGWEVTEAGKNFLDEVQSLWKASVLLRLGYTQRNVLEGWLRTAAVLGTVPALMQPVKSLSRFTKNTDRRLSFRMKKQLARDEERIANEVVEKQKLIPLETDPAKAADLQLQVDKGIRDLDEIRATRQELMKRDRMGDNEAFAGDLGQMYRDQSAGYQTMDNFLQSNWTRRLNASVAQNQWVKIKPGKPQYWDELAGSVRQFRNDEVAKMSMAGASIDDIMKWVNSAAGRTYRSDMKLSHKATGEHVERIDAMVNNYLPTPEARALAAARDVDASELQQMLGALENLGKTPKKPDPARFVDSATGQFDQLKFDKATAKYERNLLKYQSTVGLQPIHGREVALNMRSKASAAEIAQRPINAIFKYIGTLPEASLVRHPFYNETWKREFARQSDVAKGQGVDLTPQVLERINMVSHRVASRATNETLYTIERMSNPAALMRWVAPFFPAWENSAKVWMKIAINDPSVVARANILWNLPNQMGMVVDKDGNKVGRENLGFLTGAQDRYVVLPDALNDVFMKYSGGVPFKAPQGSLNVVTPGEAPYLPGVGPLGAVPVGLILQSKPDVQDWMRKNIPAAFQQIAPFGEVQGFEQLLPSAGRKAWTLWQGESNADYLAAVDAMVAVANVDWQKAGSDPATKPDYEDAIEKARNFYLFGIVSSLTSPAALTRTSKYQLEVDGWRSISQDPTMTYKQKVAAFTETFGESYLPMITSTSKYAAGKYIDPSIESWRVLTDNEELVRELAGLDPEAIGVLMSAAPKGEFDQGVYGALEKMTVPGTNDVYRGKRTPQEMQEAIEMSAAWREYAQMKEGRDAALVRLGVKTMEASAAAGVKAAWKAFTGEYMLQKYGDQWAVNYGGFLDRTPTYITAINVAMNNEKFMASSGKTPLWQNISEYMSSRDAAVRAVAGGADPTLVNKMFAEWSAEFKLTSLEFSDFWDNYLENDSVTNVVGGGV